MELALLETFLNPTSFSFAVAAFLLVRMEMTQREIVHVLAEVVKNQRVHKEILRALNKRK